MRRSLIEQKRLTQSSIMFEGKVSPPDLWR